uniref:Uncharacterized protein n=1 Tax=Arundo donax TaxID=35708 RepID=A0A0A8YQU4_ARUDO
MQMVVVLELSFSTVFSILHNSQFHYVCAYVPILFSF